MHFAASQLLRTFCRRWSCGCSPSRKPPQQRPPQQAPAFARCCRPQRGGAARPCPQHPPTRLLSRRQQEARWACATAACGTRGLPAQRPRSSPPRARATNKRRTRPRCASQAQARLPRRPHNGPRLRGAHRPRCPAHDQGFQVWRRDAKNRSCRTFSAFRCTESLCACTTSCAHRRACSSVCVHSV